MTSENSSRVLFGHSLLALGTTGLRGMSGLLLSLIIANGFSAGEFGGFRYFQLTIGVLVAIAAPGMMTVATKYFAVVSTGEETKPPIAHLGLLSLSMSFIIAFACLLIPSTFLGVETGQVHLLLVAIVFFASLNFLPMGALTGLRLFLPAFLVELISLTLILTVATYAVFSGQIVVAIWGLLVSALAAVVCNVVFVIRRIGPPAIVQSWNNSDFNAAVRQIMATFGPLSAVSILLAATFWVVGWFINHVNTSPLPFAFYSIGLQWFVLANTIPDVLGRVFFQRFVSAEDQQIPLLKMGILVSLASSASIAFLGLIASPFIMALYGNQYSAAPFLVGAFAFAAVPNGVMTILGYAHIARNSERVVLLAFFVQFLVAIAALFFLDSSWAYSGAIALTCGVAAGLAVSSFFWGKKGHAATA